MKPWDHIAEALDAGGNIRVRKVVTDSGTCWIFSFDVPHGGRRYIADAGSAAAVFRRLCELAESHIS